MEKFKCVECGVNDVEDKDDLCDECFYDECDEDEDFEEDAE